MRSQILNELARYDLALSPHDLSERIYGNVFQYRCIEEELEAMAGEGTLERVKGQNRVTLYRLPSDSPGGAA